MCTNCLSRKQSAASVDLARRNALLLVGSAALVPLVGGCDRISEIPARLIPDGMVEQMGSESWQRIVAQTAPSRDPEYISTAAEITGRLLAAAGETPASWEVRVFAGAEVNAFALPGGKIGIYEGMFSLAELPDQLAAVIGHEIGHNTARHSEERIAAAMAQELGLRLVSTALQLGDIAYANEIAALLGIGVEFGLVLPYSRRQELEADRIGLSVMDQAGYDPRQAITLWQRMAAMGGGRGPAFLSTHPDPERRIEALSAILEEGVGL